MKVISDSNQFKTFIKLLSDESGKIIRNYFRTKISVDSKSDLSPVTIADKKAEEVMRELIMKQFPEHGIIGEEFGEYNSYAEYKWVLDPIDGTKSFICGAINFGTLIALTKNNQPILGAINQPILNEFLIGDNQTAELNNAIVKIRNCKKLSDAIMLTGDHLTALKYQSKKNFEELITKVNLYRNLGDCYAYYLLSSGFVDIVIDPIMNIWDTMALIPIINGAGGIITDCNGNDATKGNSVVASSKNIHNEIIKILISIPSKND